MLTHPTFDLLVSLGLHGMAKGFQELQDQPEARTLEHGEWLALLLDREHTLRRQKRFESRARAAKLRHPASVEDVDFHAARGLDRALFMKLSSCDWIRARHNLLLSGPCGVGKSCAVGPRGPRSPAGLACALGHKACRDDLSVAYHRAPRLFAALELARPRPDLRGGRYARMLKALARVDLLILDDWGPEKLADNQRRDLLEIVEDRYERRATIVTSQLPVERWYEIIGNPTIADAIMDRLVHNAYRIELTGDSLRKRRPQKPTETPA